MVGREDDGDAWRNDPDLTKKIAEEIAEQAKNITPDQFAEHVTAKGWSAWRPADSEQANDVAVDEFVEQFGEEMPKIASGIDGGVDGEMRGYLEHEAAAEEIAEEFDGDSLLLQAIREVFDRLRDHGLELPN